MILDATNYFATRCQKTDLYCAIIKALEKSKILLNNEDLSITEVALECGFNSGSYYAELFKKYNGCTPRNFRKYKK